MKFIFVLILIMLSLGTLFTILETADATHVRPIIHTGKSRRCSVRVSGQTYPVVYEGNRRQNPDGTAYPGDSVHFIFKLSGSDTCRNFRSGALTADGAFKVTAHQIISPKSSSRGSHNLGESYITNVSQKHPLEDQSSIDAFQKIVSRSCGVLGRNAKCIVGHVEIGLALVKEKCHIVNRRRVCVEVDDIVTQTVEGRGRSCRKGKCSYYTARSSGSTGITVEDPTPNVRYTNPPILDLDEYDSKNKDGTYYTWDTPSIVIKPDKLFRDVRNDILSFDIKRLNNPIQQIFADHCTDERCTITATSQHTTDTTVGGMINGDRLEVFMVQSLEKLGIQDFKYNVKMFNIGRLISNTNHGTDLFIVDYLPKYSKDILSYVILETDGKISIEKQWGLAMQYHGSQGTGPDDDGKLHNDRRSKINDSIHAILAVDTSVRDRDDFFGKNPVNATYYLSGGDDITDIVDSVEPTILETSGKDSLGKYENALLSNGNTSLFTNDGFGRIKFTESGLVSYSDNSTLIDITLHNTIQSVDFGGYDETEIQSFSYDYPSVYLAAILNVTGVHSDGTINDTLDIDAEFRVHEINGTKYLAEYMASHIRNLPYVEKTHDEAYVDMYLGDMYGIPNRVSGVGSVTHQINLPAVYIVPELWNTLNIKRDNDPSFSTYGEGYALGSPGSYDLVIKSNGRENSIPIRTFDFSRSINYTINVDTDNYLNHTRYLTAVYIESPDVFGQISYLHVNGGDNVTACPSHCYLSIKENSTITAENIWGGTAQLYIPKQVLNGTGDQSEIVRAYIDNVGHVVLFVVTIMIIVWAYCKYSK